MPSKKNTALDTVRHLVVNLCINLIFFLCPVDPEPVIRSFVLQLLLKANFDEAQEYMETFFNRSFKVCSYLPNKVNFKVITVITRYSEVLNLHYIASLGEKELKIFTIL